jgi:hypothetical protein
MFGRKRLLLLIVFFIGIVAFKSSDKWILKDLAVEPLKANKPIVMPTEINKDFINIVNKCFVPTATAYGYTLRITSGYRSVTEQDQLYEQGRTENGDIVTWAEPGKSMHNYGYAVDVVDRLHGYEIDWKKLAKIGEYCGLTQVDDPHFEYRGGLTTAQFESGELPIAPTPPCQLMAEKTDLGKSLTLTDLKSCGVKI